MSDRRHFLSIAGVALLARLLVAPVQAWGSPRNAEAFGASSLESIFAALSLPAPIESRAIAIAAPDVAENGAQVPVEVTIGIDDVERVLLIGEGNRRPLLADFRRGERSLSWFATRVRLSENSRLLVIAEAGGRLYSAARPIRVIVGGCPG
ncbi:thiosulfate oxidation carrier protein SoxY [Accumulibacter sp.]|uniref:thiosulfate oxidation carrier protein SoxY n=1 Tax=Accumulibacter sp. TaxID=2053492 RepID=UPI0025E0E97C|nr:thiosulfate oxidation carrier protein SoxY [Accumulibacter sp.]MCM8624376.1 hypothetical protein [Accumulibacter sp.]